MLQLSALLTLAAASGSAPFVDATEALGVDFRHFNGMTGEVYLPEIVGAGAALFDYDGDGDQDLYLVQGVLLGPGARMEDAVFPTDQRLSDRLYRNDGDAGFSDVTAEAGIPDAIYGMGVATGDVDGDGDLDLLVTGLGARRLLINDGRGAFTDRTASWGLAGDSWSVPASFLDYDGDGDLDLYLGNYVRYRFPPPRNCSSATDLIDYCAPQAFEPAEDQLYRNEGTRFVDVSERAGITAAYGPALGVIAADLDDDGDTDVYVANDGEANQLWLNQGDGSFVDDALLAGVALNADGMAEASMGVDAADFDGDGDLDLFMTHLTKETNTLYVNDGSGLFDDRTAVSGLGASSFPSTGFGTAWFDYDNDGHLDLFVANGAVYIIGALQDAGDPFPLHQRNQLYRGLGDGRYQDVSDTAGAALASSEVSRGVAVGDLDDDGDPDLVITNNSGPARVLLNVVGQDAAWIGFDLREASGAPALGARVELMLDEGSRWRRVRSDGSYASANDPRVLFGLGERRGSFRGRVHWHDGSTRDFELPAGSYHRIMRGAP